MKTAKGTLGRGVVGGKGSPRKGERELRGRKEGKRGGGGREGIWTPTT